MLPCNLRKTTLVFLLLAATPLEASSVTLNVWFKSLQYLSILRSSLYDTSLSCVEVSWRKTFFDFFCDFSLEGGGTLPPNSYKPSQDL